MRKCKECGSYAINHCSHGRDGSDVDLCDVCYWRKRAASIQQAEEPRYKLSCGCPSQYGGIPAEWATTDREGNPAIAYGVICEKHWHEYDAQHPKVWQDPVAYVLRTLSSKSISDEIAPTGWSTFESKIEKLRADPWVQNGIAEIVPLYTSPQQREWQGLTEKEVKKLADTHLVHQPESYEMSGVFDLIRAVAEKLKEKNT